MNKMIRLTLALVMAVALTPVAFADSLNPGQSGGPVGPSGNPGLVFGPVGGFDPIGNGPIINNPGDNGPQVDGNSQTAFAGGLVQPRFIEYRGTEAVYENELPMVAESKGTPTCGMSGCVDLRETLTYKKQMLEVFLQILKNGQAKLFPEIVKQASEMLAQS